MTRTTRLLATAAAGAIMVAMASRAMAFDDVDWDWKKSVHEDIWIDIHTNIYINPTGLVELEKWQLSFGDIKATATVHGVYNNAATGSGTGGTDTFTFNPVYYDPINGNLPCDDPNLPCVITPQEGVASGNSGITATLESGQVDESGNKINNLVVTVTAPETEALNAKDLPEVLNSATAVANNQSITTTTALFLHDLQVAAGDINPYYSGYDGVASVGNYDYGNSSQEVAGLVILGAILGVVDEAHITAYASVSDILNAFVDNSATAVGNNASYTVNAATVGDGYVIADVTQLLIGDVRATARVSNVSINGYAGFGEAGFNIDGTPIVSNVATAVGNNLVIKVDNCTLCTPK